MLKINKGKLAAYKFHLIEGFSDDVEHVVLTRAGGVSREPYNSLNLRFKVGDEVEAVKENRRRVMQAVGLKRAISADQTHSNNVLVIDEEMAGRVFEGGRETVEVTDTDGFVTNQKRIGLMIQVADCQAILFYDPGQKVLGVAHAGWKGLKQNISKTVIDEMVKLGSKVENILVGVSPSLGPEHSEFTDPLKELGVEFAPFIKGRKVDMWEFSRKQLIKNGISDHKIEFARIDTADEKEGKKFFSFRRENKLTGRFGLIAFIK